VKRLLVIANLHHASPRIPGLVSALPEHGWEAVIITTPLEANAPEVLGFPEGFLDKASVIQVPYKGDIFWMWRGLFRLLGFDMKESLTEQIKDRAGVRHKRSFVDELMRAYQTLFAYPDTERTWMRPGLRVARQAAKSQSFDAILSSSPFPTSHRIANRLQRETGLPWIADFRDTWTDNPTYDFPTFRKRLERRLEIRTLESAGALVTVSDAYADQLRRTHGRDVVVIPNGFTFQPDGTSPLSERFRITYTGTIYTEKQDPEKFLLALAQLIADGAIDPRDVEVHFFGRRDHWLNSRIAAHGLESVVIQRGSVSRRDAVAEQRKSQLLLFLNWEDRENKGLSHLKLYEYLAAGRPILATGGHGDDSSRNILAHTNTGYFAPTVAGIKLALSTTYRQYRDDGRVAYRGRADAISEYSYAGRARLLARCLDSVLKRTPPLPGGNESRSTCV
jgi:glycosyltransferase involved in cell wall biosynthesis